MVFNRELTCIQILADITSNQNRFGKLGHPRFDGLIPFFFHQLFSSENFDSFRFTSKYLIYMLLWLEIEPSMLHWSSRKITYYAGLCDYLGSTLSNKAVYSRYCMDAISIGLQIDRDICYSLCSTGILQGSILNPLLCVPLINDMVSCSKALQFVDDLKISNSLIAFEVRLELCMLFS